jgi:hypothetical protein
MAAVPSGPSLDSTPHYTQFKKKIIDFTLLYFNFMPQRVTVDPRAGLNDMEKWKFFTLSGLELPLPLVVQPVASRYTDWAIPAPSLLYLTYNNNISVTMESSKTYLYTLFSHKVFRP